MDRWAYEHSFAHVHVHVKSNGFKLLEGYSITPYYESIFITESNDPYGGEGIPVNIIKDRVEKFIFCIFV